MRNGLWVLNVFAAIWGLAGIVVGHWPLWLTILPLALSAAILFAASRLKLGPNDPAARARIGRLVGIWSAVEGVAIFVTANVLINLHRPTALMPAIAIIVGLHFLPLARGIPVRLYYATGAALIALGLAALSLPPFGRALVTGLGAALIMWTSAIVLLRRGRA